MRRKLRRLEIRLNGKVLVEFILESVQHSSTGTGCIPEHLIKTSIFILECCSSKSVFATNIEILNIYFSY